MLTTNGADAEMVYMPFATRHSLLSRQFMAAGLTTPGSDVPVILINSLYMPALGLINTHLLLSPCRNTGGMDAFVITDDCCIHITGTIDCIMAMEI